MSGSSSLQRITTRTSTSRAPFNPPPLPPRPAKAALPDLPQSPPQASRTARPGPPPLPPRPRTDPIVLAANEPFYGSVPPSDPDGDLDEEKTGLRIAPSVRRFRFYPRTRRGRWWFWGILSGLVIAVAIVIAVCVTQIRHTDSTSISTNSGGDNGGHPLPIADGGPAIGKPGDIPTFGTNSTDHFLLRNNRSIVVTRLDPIVNPGAIGSHVHRVYGSSFFTPNLTSATEAQKVSDCTTVPVQDDRSAYWVASVYYRYPNGSLVAIPLDHHSAYYFMKAPTGVPIYAFPDNFNIVAGNPYRRSFNNSDRSVLIHEAPCVAC